MNEGMHLVAVYSMAAYTVGELERMLDERYGDKSHEVVCDNVEILDKREQSIDYAAQKAEDASILDGAEVLTDDEDLPF